MCHFYQHLHITFVVLSFVRFVAALPNRHLSVSSAGIDFLSPRSVGIRFFAILNNTSHSEAYQVDLIPEKCCLNTGNGRRDCRSMELVGLHLDSIPAATVINVKLVAPLLNPLNRRGNCIVNLDSKNVEKRSKSMRDQFKIDFDTNLENLDDELYETVNDIPKCKHIDQDPLSDCGPVDCDIHYNGQKSFFNRNLRQCSRVPKCVSNSHMDDDIIYNPRSNLCQKALMVVKEDLEFIRSLQDDNVTSPPTTDHSLEVEVSTLTQELELKQAQVSWASIGNKNTAILGGIILLQFFALVFVCCRYTKTCRSGKGQTKNKIRSIFHCQQNASDTTPLIGVSNTETTDYVNESFPSNTALQVKSYKSIQKEFNDDHVKKAQSEDILTKCLNRRSWKPSSHTDLIPEYRSSKIFEDLVDKLTDCSEGSSKVYRPQYQQGIESRVSYVNENSTKNTIIYDDDDEYHDIHKGQDSEEEIKCHSYSADKSSTKSTPDDGESIGNTQFVQTSAQINFSSDSIDKILEKKSLYKMTPLQLSQYSFPDTKTTASTCSSDTVRGRLKAKWCKMFPTKSKSVSKSDPGKEMSVNLEMLHLSKMSMHSSSINETE